MKTFHLIIIAYLLVAIITLQSRYNLSAQVPENFEFLDNSTLFNTPGAQKVTDEGIIYASNIGQSTHIVLANNDNTITILDDSACPYKSKSKIYEINDSTIQIILYNLIDYDFGVAGFFKYTITNNKIDSIEHINFGDYRAHIIGYEIASDGTQWAITPSSAFKVTPDNIIEEFEFYDHIWVDTNTALDRFDNLYITMLDGIYRITDHGRIGDVLSFNEWVADIAIHGDYYYVLLFGELRRYSLFYRNLLNSWPISTEVKSFNQVIIYDDHLNVCYTDGSNYVLSLNFNGTISSVWNDLTEFNPGKITHIYQVNDSALFSSGHYESQYTSHTFFRNINLNSTNNYYRHTVDINNTTIDESNVETMFSVPNIDTIWFTVADYEFNFDLHNRGESEASNIHIIGPVLDGFKSKNKHYVSDSFIASREQFVFNFTDNENKKSFDGVLFEIPVVDFRFNLGNSAKVDFSSSVSEAISELDLSLYPNPASNVLYLPVSISSVSVFNTTGQLVIQKNISENQLDVSQLQSGIYNLVVQSLDSEQFNSFKFVKH